MARVSADIPPEYHGLRDARDRDMAATFQRELIQIEAGNRFHDQRTPLSTLLSIYSALARQDVDDYRSLLYRPLSLEEERPHIKQAAYTADQLTVLRIPPWPENPGDGYVHPVYLCRRGSLIHEFTQLFAYRDGGWYSYSTQWPRHKEPAETEPGRIESAKAQGYLTDWEVVGPYVQKDKNAEQLFDIPFGPELSGVDVPWHSAKVEPYEEHPVSVDISSVLLPVDQSVAYLRTEILSDTQKPVRLEIYTDDGVKAWLNGEIILESNNSRGISQQPDAVNVTLKQGVNHLMLKVTEDIWGSRAIVQIGSDRAADPRPMNKAICPETRVRLDWTPAIAARSHRVYFGDDPNDMPLLAEVSEAQRLQPLSLEEDHRYYWRVDGVLADGSSIEVTCGVSPQVHKWPGGPLMVMQRTGLSTPSTGPSTGIPVGFLG